MKRAFNVRTGKIGRVVTASGPGKALTIVLNDYVGLTGGNATSEIGRTVTVLDECVP